MADSKLSALTEATTLGDTDELYSNDSGVSKRITAANLRTVMQSNLGAIASKPSNLAASVAPTTTDDTPDYEVGSIWIDTTADKAYVCLDNTASSAVWTEITQAGGGTVDTSGTPVALDFAKFTDADTIEGRSYAETRTDLGLVIGTNVQAWSAVLDATTASFLTADETKLDAITGSNTGDEVSATDALEGIVELATQTEVNTGTDPTRVVTPDTLAGAPRAFSIAVFDSDVNCATGDGKLAFCVPLIMANMDITDVVATVHTSGTTGTMDIQLRRRRDTTDADVLTTKVTIDTGETSSTTAAAAHSINATNDDLNEGDLIYVDVDAVHTTPATGLTVTVTCQEP